MRKSDRRLYYFLAEELKLPVRIIYRMGLFEAHRLYFMADHARATMLSTVWKTTKIRRKYKSEREAKATADIASKSKQQERVSP